VSEAASSSDTAPVGAAGSPLGTAASIRLVAGRELRERLRARSFHVLTAALVLIILALGFVGRFADGGPDPLEVGIVADGADGIAASLERSASAADLEVEVQDYDDVASAREALEDGEVSLVVVPTDGTVLSDDAPPEGDLALVQQAWAGEELQRSLAGQGLDAEQVVEVLSTTPLEVRELDGGGEDDALAVLVGTFAAVLLFIALQTFGGYVLTGVVEEKSTAVVEILLVRVSADRLLAGKVIGIGVAALIQLAAAVAAGVAALAISGIDVPAAVWTSVPTTLFWFLGGYALYSTLFALAGSLVSRQEDAQAASAPIMTALVGAYLLVFIFGYVPDSTASRIMSVLPPIAPLLMPMRIAAGAASVLEIVLAAVLLVAATIGAWKLAGRIYERVLLRRGARIGWRAALRLGRSDRAPLR
jgi:ABC-2 type transport system permease protein